MCILTCMWHIKANLFLFPACSLLCSSASVRFTVSVCMCQPVACKQTSYMCQPDTFMLVCTCARAHVCVCAFFLYVFFLFWVAKDGENKRRVWRMCRGVNTDITVLIKPSYLVAVRRPRGVKCTCECVKVICASSVVYARVRLSVCERALFLCIRNLCVCVRACIYACVCVCAGQCL